MSENGAPTSSPSPELQLALQQSLAGPGPLQSDPQLQASPMFGGTALQPSLPTLGPLAPTVLVHAPHFHWQATTVQSGVDEEARSVLKRVAREQWEEMQGLQRELEALQDRLAALQTAEAAGTKTLRAWVTTECPVKLRHLRQANKARVFPQSTF